MNADALTRGVITRRFRLGELDNAAAVHRRVPAARHGFAGGERQSRLMRTCSGRCCARCCWTPGFR